VIGDGLRSRTHGRQATEVAIADRALNRMFDFGRPKHDQFRNHNHQILA
jgi:hypothetical protein